MHRHRLPAPDGDILEFLPDYRLRYGVAGAVAVAWTVLLLVALLAPAALSLGRFDSGVVVAVVTAISGFVYTGLAPFFRSQSLRIDRRAGSVQVRKGFAFAMGAWVDVAPFDPAVPLRFRFCKAELQSLCLLTCQPPGAPQLLWVVYTDMGVAHEAVLLLRAWDPALSVSEEQDQSAVALARTEKPLVD